MEQLNFKISNRTISVYLGKNSFFNLYSLASPDKNYSKYFFIIDEKILIFHAEKISEVISRIDNASVFPLKSVSEKNKNINTVENLYTWLLEKGADRKSIIIAIGGGISGDIAGFAASTFMRGIDFVNVPTTLLSMADSALGGKTGVNFGGTKNIIGSFFHPRFILIDPDFLSALDEKQYLSGMGEILKYCYIADNQFLERFLRNEAEIYNRSSDALSEIILQSVQLKGNVVEYDPVETSLRKILNFGHTWGHAIESASDFKIDHGIAVAAGLAADLFLSGLYNNMTDKNLFTPLKTFFAKAPIELPPFEIVYRFMQKDKKNRGDKILSVLLIKPGELLVDFEIEYSFAEKAYTLAKKFIEGGKSF